ncbi:MAG: phosphoenolpyruvate--protein phosphotransferase [Endomicrobium sp.]|jgi:phosphotransferase system enzyme I (PtsI)|nr:phosphoenolpyruvate--protein phosphotransferase [Endomicrobium sp.]
MSNEKNVILRGVAASSGIAIGKVFLLTDDDFSLVYKEVPKSERCFEKKRLDDAIEKTKTEFKLICDKINKVLVGNYAHIADVHLLILDDPMLKKDVCKFIDDGVNAECAILNVINKIIRSFEAIEDGYFKERKTDIQYVGKKIIDNLLGRQKKTFANLSKDSIVIAHNLTPADAVVIRENLVKGFATDIGGKTSHTAIVAQGLAIPAVVGLRTISLQVRTGDEIIVDGNRGEIILNPEPRTIAKYIKEHDVQVVKIKELEKLRDLPAETIDNHKVSIFANIENPDDVASILNHGATGIGLYRTEFMYFNRNSIPSEQEHFDKYSKIVKEMTPYETTIRTVDLGGDRLTKLGLLNIGHEKNPFLGLRAMRLCLKHPDIFVDQLRGILKASAYGKVRLMYPMITSIEELRGANRILEKVKHDLREKHIKFDEKIKIGVMIEVPSAAMIIDIIAREVDFVSIGTNDLIQYTLAIDRVNENVSNLYDPLHPAILRFIKQIVDGCHKAGISVGMCGEMAGDQQYTSILLGLGLDEFSVPSAHVPKIKKVVRNTFFSNVQKNADEILKCGSRDSVLQTMKMLSKYDKNMFI